MKLEGLHILLTYQCNLECDHCFVWSSSRQTGTFTLRRLDDLLSQAKAVPECRWIYFEGGEPFLHHPVLAAGVASAHAAGFKVGIVTNAYWATNEEDALVWLEPFAGKIADLSVSRDAFHGNEAPASNAITAAKRLGIPVAAIRVSEPASCAPAGTGQVPHEESAVMFRGRAAETLAPKAHRSPGTGFASCPHEDLEDPGRVHVDPFGFVHVCQGIAIGNLLEEPLNAICERYAPRAHPVVGPLLRGGPAELARSQKLPLGGGFADACHLCYATRRALRGRFPGVLAPDAMYGVPAGG